MNDITTEQFRTLIRLIAPLRTLIKQIEKSSFLNEGNGTAHVAIRNYASIFETIANILDDPYVQTLNVDLPDDANDAVILAQILLVGKQLLSTIESYTGVPQPESHRGIHIAINANNTSEQNQKQVFDLVRQALSEQ